MKCRLSQISDSNTKKGLNEAINDLRNWKLCQEKAKTWIEANEKQICCLSFFVIHISSFQA